MTETKTMCVDNIVSAIYNQTGAFRGLGIIAKGNEVKCIFNPFIDGLWGGSLSPPIETVSNTVITCACVCLFSPYLINREEGLVVNYRTK